MAHKTPGAAAKRIRQEAAFDRLTKRLPSVLTSWPPALQQEYNKLKDAIRR
jgi:hypothetical protein